VETKWVDAGAWPELVQSLTTEGWWLADLCGVDRSNLVNTGQGQAAEAGVAREQPEANNARPESGPEDPTTPEAADTPAGPESADVSGSDEAPADEGRFEVVAQFLHRDRRERATVHVLAHGEPPRVPSIAELWPSADFMEREAFDLMGIVFDGHPNLSRIMLPDGWEGHPLRKDYGVGKVPIEFIPQPFLQFDSPHQQPNSPEAGVSVDRLGQPAGEPGRSAGGLSHFDDTKIDSEPDPSEGPS
jgi:NADH:ubiquinone oxidoreductase subunit C